MPFVLIVIGLALLISGVRGTNGQLGALLVGDLTGKDNYLYWLLAIFAIGAVGYVNDLKSVSNSLLALVIVVLFLSHQGFFSQFSQALQAGTASAPNTGTVNA